MKNVRKNLALVLSMLLLCMVFSAVGAQAENSNLFHNGSLDMEDWYYLHGPTDGGPEERRTQFMWTMWIRLRKVRLIFIIRPAA